MNRVVYTAVNGLFLKEIAAEDRSPAEGRIVRRQSRTRANLAITPRESTITKRGERALLSASHGSDHLRNVLVNRLQD